MADEGLLGTADEQAAQALIASATRELAGRSGGMPQAFVAQLFSRAAAEDLVRYEARELAALAAEAWTLLQARTPGEPMIRIESRFGPPGSAQVNAITVIEVLNDNMPFLLDSVMGELAEQGQTVKLVVHPILSVERDAAGQLVAFHGDAPTGSRESLIHVHVERIDDRARQAVIAEGLERTLTDVRRAVTDWRLMLSRVRSLTDEIKQTPPPLPVDEIAEAVQFLEWLADNNFTLLGMRDYAFVPETDELEPLFGTGLGVLRESSARVLRRDSEADSETAEIRAFLKEPKPLIITKANMRSRVHRRVQMDSIGIKHFDDDGRLTGELRLVGLFTSTAYTRSTRSIPYLRRKVDAVISRAGFEPDSHSGKVLANVLENYPRDELFQIDEDTLYRFALAIMQLDERPRVRVLARRDRFGRFVTVLVFVPRDRYGSHIRTAIGDYLAVAFKGRVGGFHPFFPEGPLVRVQFTIERADGEMASVDQPSLEVAVAGIVRTWADGLADALAAAHEAGQARALFERYRDVFSEGYREAYAPETAVADIRFIESLSEHRPLGVDFYERQDETACAGLKVWSRGHPIALSERVPVLENMGFKVVDERTYEVAPTSEGAPAVWLHDMVLQGAPGATDFATVEPRLEACFLMVMRGLAESDGFNALVLKAGLPWRDVALLRTIARYLRQARIPYSQDYLWATLVRHAALATRIVVLFHTRFDPRSDMSLEDRAAREAADLDAILAGLQAVESLDDDQILRRFINAVQSALRTNFYQIDRDGQPMQTISIKFDSRKLDALPLPRPLYEIFVYSPRVEGVHLRFGKVARGGIRWSDRPQDFRTEVLGLVKAQQVKNAVIVPVGAKGGFVPKRLPVGGTREAVQAEGIAAYTIFIHSLLDITDNLGREGIVAPDNVVRHDGDDPYLVVAADKGTATFSDLANSLSIAHEFWLGDAFASGGSAGYDHKGMGITARGAWEAVKRHFRELDTDIMTTPFTVAGVGDMSGDVFGNGMLLAKTAKLVAAFDHRDIFLDPDPDPAASHAERERLFRLPRSSWQDYGKEKISAGGGVFSRKAKEIKLSAQAQTMLGLAHATATPAEVMRAILTMNVDLLWFGGIGTYVRASTESDDEVGDRGNDAIRVKASELQCRVIGEGANLGMTQRGRVEAAGHGIKLNTDAIDNSAGVNTSDVEVNIKIALSAPVRDGALTPEDRNALLAEMTNDVAGLVLRNNYLQTLALSLAEQRGLDDLGFQERLMQALESRGELDRNVEFLPDDKALTERRRRGQGLTRPELAVLMAYAKLSLYDALLESNVPDDPYLGRELMAYFPTAMRERFPQAIGQHRLRREIIATQLANSIINRGGSTLVTRIADQTGALPEGIAAAFAVVRDSYGMTTLNTAIDSLDGKIGGKLQLELYRAVQDLLLDRIVWFVRNVDLGKGLATLIEHYRAGIALVGSAIDSALPLEARTLRDTRAADLAAAGVPEVLARAIATLPALAAAPDIVLVADRTNKPIAEVAATYFAAGAFFQLDRIVGAARAIQVTDYFDRLALDRALDSIGSAERQIAAEMVADGAAGPAAVDAWVKPRAGEVDRIRGAVHEIAGSGLTLSKLSVAASLLGDLVRH